MTRPQIIRADTIDLQDQGNPSAKDHSRQPTNPAPLGDGPPAPHQAIALKNAGYEPLEIHHSRSPRASQDLSGKELQLLHDIDGHDGIEEDPLGIHLQSNGDGVEHHGEDGEVGDQDGDDSLDDDMMDKISSSPSIDSGGYGLPWMNANSSILSTPEAAKKKQHQATDPETPSSSPFLSTPEHFPLSFSQPDHPTTTSEDHHQGECPAQEPSRMPREDSFSSEARDRLMPLISETRMDYFREDVDSAQNAYDADFDDTDLHNFLIPADDPLLDNSFDDGGHFSPASPTGSDSPEPDWNDQAPDDNDCDNDDDTEDISFTDSRFVDSGWGGECLREIEDISFEFVYALHTFVATVEGQANATKGDTMVLLDDSNSYWWLVRVVKDSSIGYLPAEHIETPTERLARLNKHRNIDLSQTMLGDNPEKSKNPLKKAMRRRNAKTVQFAPPTFYEPSDNEYSSDEEGEGGELPELTDAGGLALQNSDTQSTQEEVATVEPLKIRSQQTEAAAKDEIQADIQAAQDEPQVSRLRSSEDSALRPEEGASSKSRNGTLRNTDSFFKDDTQETRKITITPVLFRDDSSSSTLTPTDSKEPKTRPSLDTVEKAASPSDKSKDAKDGKSKEKKHGMLSGLFKRKDRKSKSQSPGDDEDPDWLAKEISNQSRQPPQSKVSSESQPKSSSDSQPKVSSDLTSQDTRSGRASPGSRSPSRQGSKLQKPQPIRVSPTKRSPSREGQVSPTKASVAEQPTPVLAPTELYPTSTQRSGPAENERQKAVQSERIVAEPDPVKHLEPKQVAEKPLLSPTESKSRGGAFSSIREALRLPPSSPTSTEPAKPVKAVKAKERMQIDDFDSSPEAEVAPLASLQYPESLKHSEPPQREAPQQPEEPEEPKPRTESANDRLSESPVQVSPIHAVDPPPLAGTAGDTSSQEEPSMSMSTSSTPELVEAPHEESTQEEERTPTSTIQSSHSAPTWSDASLRTYLEDDTEIRDLLVVVHDKSDVKPVGPDHHVVQNLCKEENRRLGEMSTRLDNLLQDLLARKSRAAVK